MQQTRRFYEICWSTRHSLETIPR